MSTTLNTLVNDYKALLDFIYKGEDWTKELSTRQPDPSDFRHIIRTLILQERKPTLKQIGKAEGVLLKKAAPDHSTIINSRDHYNDVLKDRYPVLTKQLLRFYRSLIAREKQIKSKGTHPFKLDYIDGVVQIHLHFTGAPSREFLDGLKALVVAENEEVSV